MASFDVGEFESVKEDKTVKLASSYNWDQTGPASATSLDPNSDDFFNSMLANDKKVHTTVPNEIIQIIMQIKLSEDNMCHWLDDDSDNFE